MVTVVPGSYPKIRNVASDQIYLTVDVFQPKLPVWLSFCASARYVSLRVSRAALGAAFRSSISVFVPYHLTSVPPSSRNGTAETGATDTLHRSA